MSGRRRQRASGCASQEDGVQTETMEPDMSGPREQLRKTHIMD